MKDTPQAKTAFSKTLRFLPPASLMNRFFADSQLACQGLWVEPSTRRSSFSSRALRHRFGTESEHGGMAGNMLISLEEAAGKYKVALEPRNDPDFVIIARTDARTLSDEGLAVHRQEWIL